jgi:valyl-tRNA synthetase
LHVQLRLLAPFLPYVTEEVWSWWQAGSVHRSPWPQPSDLADSGASGDADMLGAVAGALRGIRGAKSAAKVSMRTELARATVTGPAEALALAEQAADDLRASGRIVGDLAFTPDGSTEIAVDAELA